MATSLPLTTLLLVLFIISTSLDLPLTADAISGCNGDCGDLNDCKGNLICIDGKCGDDPDIGSHKCDNDPDEHKHKKKKKKKKSKDRGGGDQNGGGGGGGGSCRVHGTKECSHGSYKTYQCSPPVTSATKAILTVNSFKRGGDGGGKAECDDSYHHDSELIAALSTGWYKGGSRCGKTIRITAHNGKTVEAKVVDECDSMEGCDHEHAGQPPCKNNIVDGSPAVWKALGLNQDDGEVPVTWAMGDDE